MHGCFGQKRKKSPLFYGKEHHCKIYEGKKPLDFHDDCDYGSTADWFILQILQIVSGLLVNSTDTSI